MEEPASAFGRSAKVRNPSNVSPCSSSAVSASMPSAERVATATTRAPSENSASSADRAPSGTFTHRSSTTSGAPLVITSGWPSGSFTSTEASCRSWSKGRTPSLS